MIPGNSPSSYFSHSASISLYALYPKRIWLEHGIYPCVGIAFQPFLPHLLVSLLLLGPIGHVKDVPQPSAGFDNRRRPAFAEPFIDNESMVKLTWPLDFFK